MCQTRREDECLKVKMKRRREDLIQCCCCCYIWTNVSHVGSIVPQFFLFSKVLEAPGLAKQSLMEFSPSYHEALRIRLKR